MVAELGPLTRAMVGLARDGDNHLLAGRICRMCVEGLQVDGAALSLLTATEARETLSVTDATAATAHCHGAWMVRARIAMKTAGNTKSSPYRCGSGMRRPRTPPARTPTYLAT